MKKRQFLFLYLILILGLFFSWLWFIIDGVFPVGENLTKSDWLNFWSNYLVLISSTILSIMIYLQNKKFHDISSERISAENRPNLIIQPANKLWLKKGGYIAEGDNYLSEYIKIDFESNQLCISENNSKPVGLERLKEIYTICNCGNNTGNTVKIIIEVECATYSIIGSACLSVAFTKDMIYPIFFPKDVFSAKNVNVIKLMLEYKDIFNDTYFYNCTVELK